MDGRMLSVRVDEPKGDPGNTLMPDEIYAKALRLAAFRHGATMDEMCAHISKLSRLDERNDGIVLFND
jgi:2-methylcitrate dehydratase PrpD